MSDLIPTSSAAPARQPAAVRRPKQVVTTSFSESFAGPLPPPSLLSGYEDACAGAADRIIRVAEQEAEHRRALETAIVKSGIAEIEKQFNESKRGQICAVVITLVAIAAGTYLAMNGHELSGLAELVESLPRLSSAEAGKGSIILHQRPNHLSSHFRSSGVAPVPSIAEATL